MHSRWPCLTTRSLRHTRYIDLCQLNIIWIVFSVKEVWCTFFPSFIQTDIASFYPTHLSASCLLASMFNLIFLFYVSLVNPVLLTHVLAYTSTYLLLYHLFRYIKLIRYNDVQTHLKMYRYYNTSIYLHTLQHIVKQIF